MRKPKTVIRTHQYGVKTILHRRYGFIDLQPFEQFYTTAHRWEVWNESRLEVVRYWMKKSITAVRQ